MMRRATLLFMLLAACERQPIGTREPPVRRDARADAGHADAALDKRETLEQLLARGAVLVHVDARSAAVVVPPNHRDVDLVLRFGYALEPPIEDLRVDDDALSGTLSFDGGHPFHCVLPWRYVFRAMVESESTGLVWPDDVPAEVRAADSVRSDAGGR